MTLSESTVESAALAWLEEIGYFVLNGAEIAPGEPGAERADYGQVVLEGRLRAAIERLNPEVSEEAREEALRKVLRVGSSSLVATNRVVHRMIRDGVEVETRRVDGGVGGERVVLVDFDRIDHNDFLALNQFTVIEGKHQRRPDVLVFLNGLPVALFELKNAAKESATIWNAYEQIQTYKAEIPSLLQYNTLLILSDGDEARIGSLTANREWFKVWRTIEGEGEAPRSLTQFEVLLRGVFEKRRLLDLLQHFVVFEEDGDRGEVHKIVAGYHQFHAVHAAVAQTLRASGLALDGGLADAEGVYLTRKSEIGKPGDKRAGVVWHTQGSGKSYSMLFYAARMVRHPAMRNPTLVVITDRNDLDDQLFGQFQRCHELLGQMPVQANDRETLRRLLAVASGGVIFTTIQKFLPEKGEAMPCLTERRNVVVIADEAHRSQYGFKAQVDLKTGEKTYGFASNLRAAVPHASFIGFTGTPVEKTDANTRTVFGDYVSIYDIQKAVADQATVPIYYESRIAKLALNEKELPRIDREFEEITEGEEIGRKERIKSKWAALEALVGDGKRLDLIARDLVDHFEKRTEAMTGKAMVVCMSRRICVDLHDALVRLRPEWASVEGDDPEKEKGKACVVKVIMTGGADDGPEWQRHIRNKERRAQLAHRFKDVRDPFRIVIVRDMWLTGFDAPCLSTMYLDKPMQGHGLMQAIARVNRVFRDKPGGLVVDYLGLADQLKQALATYTESGGQGDPTFDLKQAVAVMLEKYEVCESMLHGFDWSRWTTGSPTDRLSLLPAGRERIYENEDGRNRWVKATMELSRAFALASSSAEAIEIRDDVSYFQALQAGFLKESSPSGKTPNQIDAAIRQLVSKAITTENQVIDVFTAAGIARPDLSILSESFLTEVRGLKHKNVAAELLEKLLWGEIKERAKKNLVQSKEFSEKLRKTLNAYHNRAIATQEVIEELIRLAKELDAAVKRGEELGLNDDELAFYDALAANDSAVKIMGDAQLRVIATSLVTAVRKNATVDWSIRESAQAGMRIAIKRILQKFGYPPDLQSEAVKLVVEQAKILAAEVAG